MSDLQFRKPRPVDLALAGAAISQAIVPWLTWLRLGEADRNSYELFRSAQRFDLEALDPVRFVWFFLPVGCLSAVFAVLAGRGTVAAIVLIVLSLVLGLISAAVLILGPTLVIGPILGLVSSIISLVAAVFALRSPEATV